MTEKRFDVVMNEFDEVEYITDIVDYEDRDFADFIEFANEMAKENELLKQSVNNLKDTIIKITITYQRKYDRTIVDLVDEVHEENITDLIKMLNELSTENRQLKKQLETEHQMLDNAILLERTRMGKNSLQQYKEAIQ